jgi:hypothetical protein
MKIKYIYSLIFLICSLASFSQSDTLNQIDLDGKTGWWIIYLDHNLKQLNDSSGATHCRYTYYTGKYDHYNMGTIGSKKSPVIFPESDTLKFGNLILLHGTYVSNFKDGTVQFSLTAENGILTEYKEYYSNGQLKSIITYTKSNEAPFQTSITVYHKNGNLKYDGQNQIPKD